MWKERSKIQEQGAAKAVRRVLCALSTRHLDASIRDLLSRIVFISVLQALRNGRKTKYCTPGREYLSRGVGVSLATVSSYTGRLQQGLFIEKIQRRPERGLWSTNMYKLGVAISGIVESITIEFLKILNGVKVALHIESKNIRIKLSEEENKVSNLPFKAPPPPDWLAGIIQRRITGISGAEIA